MCVLSWVQLFATSWTIYSPPGSSVHGIILGRILEWVVISCSRASSWSNPHSPAVAGRFLTTELPGKLHSPPPQHQTKFNMLLTLFEHLLCAHSVLDAEGGWVTEWIRHMISAPKVFAGEWGLGRGCRVKCSGQCCEAGSHGSGSATRATTGSSWRQLCSVPSDLDHEGQMSTAFQAEDTLWAKAQGEWTSVRQAAHP